MEERRGPLSHVRVLELAGLAPAPYCGLLLRQFGAEVVHVSRTGAQPDDPAGLSLGKRSIAIDLKSPEGVEVLRRMIKQADVLLDPFRPGVLEKLGLGPQKLIDEVNPKLIVARITGWGQTGPYAQAAGHDVNYVALTGLLSLMTRSKDDAPLPPVNLLGDFAGGGLMAALGIVMALYVRTRTGKGQIVDAAMVDGASHIGTFIHRMRANGVWKDEPASNLLDSSAPFYDVYKCSDNKYLSVVAISLKIKQLLLQGLGLDGDDAMPASQFARGEWPANKRVIAGKIATRTRDYWAHVFRPDGPYRDACVAPVLSLAEAAEHPHNKARKVFDLGITGKPTDLIPQPAPRLSVNEGFNQNFWTVPQPGENTRSVLLMYGFTNAEAEALASKGVVLMEEKKKASKL